MAAPLRSTRLDLVITEEVVVEEADTEAVVIAAAEGTSSWPSLTLRVVANKRLAVVALKSM